MSRVAICLLAIGAGLTAFGWWGQNTPAGRRRYDEMAGIIPAAAYWFGGALGIGALLWLIVAAWRDKD